MAKTSWGWRLLGGGLVLLALAACRPDRARPAGLEAAWIEYRYQNFAAAEQLFDEVRLQSVAGSAEHRQARLGLAMVMDFRLPGGRPDLAAGMYQALLDEVGLEASLAPVLLRLIADCHFNSPQPDFARADELYRQVMERFPGTAEADAAAIKRAEILMRPATPAAFQAALAWLTEFMVGHPADVALGTMHGICAQLAMALGDPAHLAVARDHLIAMLADADGDGKYELIANLSTVGDLMFQVANLSDRELGDRDTAIQYYTMLYRHTEVDERHALCRMRIEALGGRIE